MLRAIGRRQQQLDVAAEDVEARVAEHLFGGRVELADVQLRVHRDDRVVRGFENRALPRFALHAGAIHLVGQVERRRREQQRQPVARALGHRDDDGGGGGAEQVAGRARREIGLPDPPGALVRRERDRNRDRDGVDEEVGERHAGQRHHDRRVEIGDASVPPSRMIHLPGAWTVSTRIAMLNSVR